MGPAVDTTSSVTLTMIAVAARCPMEPPLMCVDSCGTPCLKMKRVRFSVATTTTFHVGWSGCVVPSDQVPGVGLQGAPIQRTSVDLFSLPEEEEKRVMRYTAQDRLYFFKRQGIAVHDVVKLCMEQNKIQVSRRITALEILQGPGSRFAKYLAKRRHQWDQRSEEPPTKRPRHGLSSPPSTQMETKVGVTPR
ncbi:Aste57867_19922 [Aphanomyces stellatus]|uniref:Aste57867_19922 protein n=1 Tax=Aphanomyces stellatus TaxID=120398 RepID=A0A485LEY4_9STRA|nr:hypothetical protein As57867_019856 [Aphanomyces stellatus]VFT96620.1 Aste57867_19922 [Aphanomyces stellatus]